MNGQKITGCECEPTNIQPDVSKGESATWTAKGCTSTANIIGYTWKGATADASGLIATAPVAAKNDEVTGVSFTVENDDSTAVTVTCDNAKAIDATLPDYLFEINGDQIKNQTFDVINEGCMSIRGNWTNSGYSPDVQILCDGRSADQNVGMTFEMTYKSKTVASYKTTAGQGWGFSNQGGVIGKITQGDVAFDNVCVTFTGAAKNAKGDETVSCKIQ